MTSCLIALYSPAPRSGKSSVARYLQLRYGYCIRPFAGPLKAMAAVLLGQLGRSTELLNGDKTDVIYGDKTLRHLLRTLGTEWGRAFMGPDFWVDLWLKECREAVKALPVVVDDMRFFNELRAVRACGGRCWQVLRPGCTVARYHPSEGALNDVTFDHVINNTGTLQDLERAVDAAVQGSQGSQGSQENT